jgi:predicted metalloprotease
MRWRDAGRSRNLEDRRGGGKRAGLGIVGVVIAIGIAYFTGADPRTVLDAVSATQAGGAGGAAESPIEDAAEEPMVRFLSSALDDAQGIWRAHFARQFSGTEYRDAKLVLFRAEVSSACGSASAAMGPFYCPGDERVYIDLGFYDALARSYGAPGDFAQVYVLAHEVGHHVQHLLGIEQATRRAQGAGPERSNALSVAMELQADCFAGVWAHAVARRGDLDPGDLEEGLGAASAVGDDRLQQQSLGRVNPETFTHGSSAERMRAFKSGFDSGDPAACRA